MIRVYCFSATGRTMVLARFLSGALSCGLEEITPGWTPASPCRGTAVVVFPVYCQSVPAPVRKALPLLCASDVALVAAYGRKSCGNALREAARLTKGRVIAGACVPIGHTYLNEPASPDTEALAPLLWRIRHPEPAKIPRRQGNLLAGVLPSLRSRIGVRLRADDSCDRCGLCTRLCPVGAMRGGTPGSACIRCLRCAAVCPKHALHASFHPWLLRYLKGRRRDRLFLYL